MFNRHNVRVAIASAVMLAGGITVYANPPGGTEGLCAGLAAAIASSSGLAKLILQVIAAFFGCGA